MLGANFLILRLIIVLKPWFINWKFSLFLTIFLPRLTLAFLSPIFNWLAEHYCVDLIRLPKTVPNIVHDCFFLFRQLSFSFFPIPAPCIGPWTFQDVIWDCNVSRLWLRRSANKIFILDDYECVLDGGSMLSDGHSKNELIKHVSRSREKCVYSNANSFQYCLPVFWGVNVSYEFNAK